MESKPLKPDPLDEQLKKESQENSFYCSVCDDSFRLSEELTYHYMTHSLVELAHSLTELQARLEEREILCTCKKPNSCDVKSDHNKGNYIAHKEKAKPGKSTSIMSTDSSLSSRSPHPCPICNNILSSRGALVKHLVTHKDKKPFKCDECKMEFNQNRDLKTHVMQKHTMQRPHVCGICQKGFVHKFYLMEHMTYHTGERQFQCFHCGKRFQAQSALTKHIKRHTAVKGFSCHLCPKSFAVKTDLNAHVKFVHEKPTSSKGIPAENGNNISFELNYEQTVNNESFEGDAEENEWITQDVADKKRYLDKQLEDWMVSQGLKLGGERPVNGVNTYIPNVPKISDHIV